VLIGGNDDIELLVSKREKHAVTSCSGLRLSGYFSKL